MPHIASAHGCSHDKVCRDLDQGVRQNFQSLGPGWTTRPPTTPAQFTTILAPGSQPASKRTNEPASRAVIRPVDIATGFITWRSTTSGRRSLHLRLVHTRFATPAAARQAKRWCRPAENEQSGRRSNVPRVCELRSLKVRIGHLRE